MSLDDQLYDIVAKEIRSGTFVDGLYTRAFAEANGDKDKAQAKYIKLRVAQLRQEVKDRAKAEAQTEAQTEAQKQKARAKPVGNQSEVDWSIVVLVILTFIFLGICLIGLIESGVFLP